MMAGIDRIVRLFPAAAVVLLLVDLVWIPTVWDEEAPVLPPAGEVLPGEAPYAFAVVGDNRGNENVYDAIIEGIKQDGAAFVLHGGDLVKRCTPKQYKWLLHEMAEQDLQVPFCPTPGNHDVLQKPVVEGDKFLYKRSFGQPHYWFAYDDTLFVAMDTSDESLQEAELEWLDRTLALHRAQYGTCIVFTHVPPRNPQPGGGHDMGADGDRVMAVLEKWRVTVLFASHVHSYAEDNMRGIPVYITGGGGAQLEHPDDAYHYLLCRVDAEGNVSVQKKDVPALPRDDYPEYVARAKLGREALRGLSAALLLVGLCHMWLMARRARRRAAKAVAGTCNADAEQAR